MEKNHSVPTYGLSDEQIQILQELSKLFRNQNEAFPRKLNEEQCKLLGQIVKEFAKP